MTRIIAVIWNARASHAEPDAEALLAGLDASGGKWVRRYVEPGLVVFDRSDAPTRTLGFPFDQASGYLCGTAFRSGSVAPARSRDVDVSTLIRSKGECLHAVLWGSYVAFVRDRHGACVYVLRDPSGAVPCFMTRRNWAFAFFSDRRDVRALALPALTINWRYLARRLRNNRSAGSETGFEEVTELAPGAIACVGQGRRTILPGWNARTFAAHPIRDKGEAARVLSSAVEIGCRAMTSGFGRIGVKLSGGLDSAIVLGLLSGARGEIFALNLVTPTPEGDERAYARSAAVRAGTPLVEALRRPNAVDLSQACVHDGCVRPHLWILNAEASAIEAAHAAEYGIEAYFTGRGGDNVFCRSPLPGPLADYFIDQGDVFGLLTRTWRYADAEGLAFGLALRDVCALVWSYVRRARLRELSFSSDVRFLSAKARALIGEDEPSCEGLGQILPGKHQHMASLSDRLNYFESAPIVPHVYPLVAQPVLEASLAIATYILSPTCADRALAREIFAGVMPPRIASRRSKGRTNSYSTSVLLNNLQFLRSYLLSGELAGEGLIGCDVLSDALTEGKIIRNSEASRAIVALLNVEAWLRNRPFAQLSAAA